jgi:hypothetical protein
LIVTGIGISTVGGALRIAIIAVVGVFWLIDTVLAAMLLRELMRGHWEWVAPLFLVAFAGSASGIVLLQQLFYVRSRHWILFIPAVSVR